MKRIIAVILMMLLICGCSAKGDVKNKKQTPTIAKGDNCDFLINAKWEGNDDICPYVVTFRADGGFSNWCYCGSEVGDADLVEKYVYRASDKAILLYDSDNKNFESGKVLYVDEYFLILDLWTRVRSYENLNAERQHVYLEALEEVGNEYITKPFLYIKEYKDNKCTVTSFNYDGDAAADFTLWQLDAVEDVTFKIVTVKDDKGTVMVDSKVLSEEDISHIGEYYTAGFCEIDDEGKIKSVVFYGELIIQ